MDGMLTLILDVFR